MTVETLSLTQVESFIQQLPFAEQLRLLERLAQTIRKQAERPEDRTAQLAAMAADPAMQSELRQIEAEFAITELDGLERL